MKRRGFKAKAAVLVVIGSVIGCGGVSATGGGLQGLVECLVSFLSNEDWAARKAAAEALGRLAVVERDSLTEFKAGCLKIFESRKYDKVCHFYYIAVLFMHLRVKGSVNFLVLCCR